MRRRWWMYGPRDRRRYIGAGSSWEQRSWWAVRLWVGRRLLGECPYCAVSARDRRNGVHKFRCPLVGK